MCGLIFAGSPLQWRDLVDANMKRAGRNKGAFTTTTIAEIQQRWFVGETVDHVSPPIQVSAMTIGHLQAPTSTASRPHPALWGGTRVWHNGLIKEQPLSALCQELGVADEWDTQIIAVILDRQGIAEGVKTLGRIEGSMACIVSRDARIYAFRNALSPLFMSSTSLSSVALNDSWEPIEAGIVYEFRGHSWQKTLLVFAVDNFLNLG